MEEFVTFCSFISSASRSDLFFSFLLFWVKKIALCYLLLLIVLQFFLRSKAKTHISYFFIEWFFFQHLLKFLIYVKGTSENLYFYLANIKLVFHFIEA